MKFTDNLTLLELLALKEYCDSYIKENSNTRSAVQKEQLKKYSQTSMYICKIIDKNFIIDENHD